MLTWILALANGIIFVFSIWFSRFHDLSELWHWLLMAIAAVLVICITAANQAKLDKNMRYVIDSLSRVETRQRKDITQRLRDYYERIVNGVGEAEIVDPLSAVATGGYFPSSGRVRDLIPKPQFGEPNDDARPN